MEKLSAIPLGATSATRRQRSSKRGQMQPRHGPKPPPRRKQLQLRASNIKQCAQHTKLVEF